MSINEICRLYLEGRKLCQQAKELSNASLARKFECNQKSVAKVANHMPVAIPEDDQQLIRACIAERDRLKSRASELSMPRLARQHKLSTHSIVKHLECMAEREIAA